MIIFFFQHRYTPFDWKMRTKFLEMFYSKNSRLAIQNSDYPFTIADDFMSSRRVVTNVVPLTL